MKVAVQNTMITKGHVLAYGVAFVATIVATLLRMVLAPLVGTAVPFATYFVAVLLVVWYAGREVHPGNCGGTLQPSPRLRHS